MAKKEKNKNQETCSAKEYFENIEGICNTHSKEKLLKYQSTTDNKYKIGDFVKSAIVCSEEQDIEHMWVKVESIDNKSKTITGKLFNTPLNVFSKIKHGDELTIKFEDISELIKNETNT